MEAARSHIGAAGVSEPAAATGDPPGRFAGLASDERLIARVRRGDEAAFTVIYKRYQPRLLSFCRHMLSSQAEAEDAVQQTFVNAYRDISGSDKQLQLRPWLYRIARNQCLTMLRARKQTVELSGQEPSLAGLSQQVQERGDLRSMLADLAALPYEQREALVLVELHDNSHSEVADVLGCDREKVKSLVFQARSSLMKSRQSRDVSCTEIQQQLSVLRGGALRRTVIRRHLEHCEGCRAFRSEVKRQRAAMAAVLPVVPAVTLKFGAASALAAGKAAVASAGAGAAAGGSSGAAAVAGTAAATSASAGTGAVGGGFASSVAAKLGISAAAVKGAATAAAVTVAAGGGVAGVEVAQHARHDSARQGIHQQADRTKEAGRDAGSSGLARDGSRKRSATASDKRLRDGKRNGERLPRSARGVDRDRFAPLPGLGPGEQTGKGRAGRAAPGAQKPATRSPERRPPPKRPPRQKPKQPSAPKHVSPTKPPPPGNGSQLPSPK
ncbi:MAG: RNA polymerase sigma factor [Solirubrobacterales bacterium]